MHVLTGMANSNPAVLEYLNFTTLSAGAVGCVTFPACLGLIQRVVFAPLRITSSMRIFASLLGSGAVFTSAGVASMATITTYSQLQGSSSNTKLSNGELCAASLAGVVIFKALGGRFNAVLPSNLFKPGAFTGNWIPARWEQYAVHYERHLMQQIGGKYGCHSCGTKSGKFIADHQPPIKLSSPGELLKFYPHCRKCASLQGNALSRIRPSRVAVRTHTSLRLYHLFLPIPLFMTVFKQSHLTTTSDTITELLATEQIAPAVETVQAPNDPVTGYQWLLASINEFLSQISMIGQFHIFVQLCIAVAAISSL